MKPTQHVLTAGLFFVAAIGCGDDQPTDSGVDGGPGDATAADTLFADQPRVDVTGTDGAISDVGMPDAPPPVGDYYVSVDGDDSSPGTLEEPFATMGAADAVAEGGDLIYVRGGVFDAPVAATVPSTPPTAPQTSPFLHPHL